MFLLLGGIVSEPATTRRIVECGIFVVGGGIFVAWFAEMGRWFLFGNDDDVERSSGRGMNFGSRFFPACPRSSSMGCLAALKSELRWSESRR